MSNFETQSLARQSMAFSAIVDIAGVHNPRTGGFHVVQDAIDAGHKSIFVRDGTYPAFDIDQAKVTVVGESWDTIVDGETAASAITISGSGVLLVGIAAKTTAGGGQTVYAITTSSSYARIIRCQVLESDAQGVYLAGTYGLISQCLIASTDSDGINLVGARNNVQDNNLLSLGAYGIQVNSAADNANIGGNVLTTSANDGIYINSLAENCCITGNKVEGWTNEAIDDDSGTSTVSGNETT